MEENELKVLQLLKENLTVDKVQVVSFEGMCHQLELKPEDLDLLLNQLDVQRFIDQFVVEGQQSFRIRLLQKGYDAVE